MLSRMSGSSSRLSRSWECSRNPLLPCPPSWATLLAQGLEQAAALAQQSLELPLICPPGNKNIQMCHFGPHQTAEISPSAWFFSPGGWGSLHSHQSSAGAIYECHLWSHSQCFSLHQQQAGDSPGIRGCVFPGSFLPSLLAGGRRSDWPCRAKQQRGTQGQCQNLLLSHGLPTSLHGKQGCAHPARVPAPRGTILGWFLVPPPRVWHPPDLPL